MYPQVAKCSSGAEQQFSSKFNMPVTSRLQSGPVEVIDLFIAHIHIGSPLQGIADSENAEEL